MAFKNLKFIRKDLENGTKNYIVMINGESVGEVSKAESATRSYWYFDYNNKYKNQIADFQSEHGYHWDSTRIGAVCEYFWQQIYNGKPLELKK